MATPTYQATGTAVSATTGTLTVAWPTHVADDIALLWVFSSAGGTTETLTTPAGFTLIETQTTGSGTAGTKHSVYWARATSSAMASPVVAAGTDFKYGLITTYRGAVTSGNPVSVFSGGVKAAASTAATLPSVTTPDDLSLVVLGITSDVDAATAFVTSMTNTALRNLTERYDLGTTAGLGGAIGIYDGVKAVAGSTGTTAAVIVSSINTYTTLALKPSVTSTVRWENTAEGGSDGTTVTAANSGGASGDPFTSVSIGTGAGLTFSNLQEAHGALSYRMVNVSGQATTLRYTWPVTSKLYVRFHFLMTAVPAAATEVLSIRDSLDAAKAFVSIGTNSRFTLSVQGTSVINPTATLSLNTWYTVEVGLSRSGDWNYQVWTTSTGVTHSSGSGTSATAPTTDFVGFRLGKVTGSTIVNDWFFDTITVDTSKLALEGVYVPSTSTYQPGQFFLIF